MELKSICVTPPYVKNEHEIAVDVYGKINYKEFIQEHDLNLEPDEDGKVWMAVAPDGDDVIVTEDNCDDVWFTIMNRTVLYHDEP